MTESEGDDGDIIELIEKGEYKLHDKLGEGSYGEVFLAERLRTREPFAIKVMQLCTRQQVRNFIKERYFATYFAHFNILQAAEVYVINDTRGDTQVEYHISQDFPSEDAMDEDEESESDRYGVLVLEPMDFDLMDYIISKGRLNEEESRVIFREICKAIQHCHAKHVAHLDLKPDNILLKLSNSDRNASVQSLKVCDFGFAVEWEQLSSVPLPPNFRILFGTKEYQAPETYKSKTVFRQYHLLDKVDVWSLGVTLFVMITGLFPFVEKNGILYTVGLDEVAKYCAMPPKPNANNANIINNNNNNNANHHHHHQSNAPCTYEETAVHLVERMLHQDPLQRPSVTEILAHPWLVEKSVVQQRVEKNKPKKKRRGSFLRNFSDKCFEVENDAFDSSDENGGAEEVEGVNGAEKKKKKKIKEKLFNMYTKLLNTHHSTGSMNSNNNNNHTNTSNSSEVKKKQ